MYLFSYQRHENLRNFVLSAFTLRYLATTRFFRFPVTPRFLTRGNLFCVFFKRNFFANRNFLICENPCHLRSIGAPLKQSGTKK